MRKLAYSYLGDWISRQRDGSKRGETGAEGCLAAALVLQTRLAAILEGEEPFDIFVRWKSIDQQAVGWAPDIDDGIRLNIRPFMMQDIPRRPTRRRRASREAQHPMGRRTRARNRCGMKSTFRGFGKTVGSLARG